MIYATPFNLKTKQATGPSVPLGVYTLDEAAAMFPTAPDWRTTNTLIYKDAALCVSWIRFKI